MFGYYLKLGLLHLRRNPVLTALMVVTLAVGVAASMATLTVLRAMSGDPLPQKSDRLFVALVDQRPTDSDPDPEPPNQLSYLDAVALHDAGKGKRQSVMFRIGPVIDPGVSGAPPFFGAGLAIHTDFFPMLDVRFTRGGPWSAEDDARAANVAVITEKLADRIFGKADPIGKTIRLAGHDHVVTGVVPTDWEPMPRFYRLIGGPGAFGFDEDVMIPFATAIAHETDPQGQISCFSDPTDGYEGLKQSSQCVWVTLWVELASPADAAGYRDFIAGYVAEQRKLGRFPRPDNHRLHDVMSWLALNQVVPKDRRLQTYLAFGFLLVCLINTIGLLLAKFGARSGEIGVRRALGATRWAVFQQYLIECGVIGLAGGAVGLVLALGCLWLIGKQSDQAANVAHMDWAMLAVTFALAVGASLMAGLLPTWRACKVQPAIQLKSQ
jgi:putative ABC transport system permease protein